MLLAVNIWLNLNDDFIGAWLRLYFVWWWGCDGLSASIKYYSVDCDHGVTEEDIIMKKHQIYQPIIK